MFKENLCRKRPLISEFKAQTPTHMGGTYPYSQYVRTSPRVVGRLENHAEPKRFMIHEKAWRNLCKFYPKEALSAYEHTMRLARYFWITISLKVMFWGPNETEIMFVIFLASTIV